MTAKSAEKFVITMGGPGNGKFERNICTYQLFVEEQHPLFLFAHAPVAGHTCGVLTDTGCCRLQSSEVQDMRTSAVRERRFSHAGGPAAARNGTRQPLPSPETECPARRQAGVPQQPVSSAIRTADGGWDSGSLTSLPHFRTVVEATHRPSRHVWDDVQQLCSQHAPPLVDRNQKIEPPKQQGKPLDQRQPACRRCEKKPCLSMQQDTISMKPFELEMQICRHSPMNIAFPPGSRRC